MILSQLNTLTHINLDDLVTSFGWQNSPLLANLLQMLFQKPAQTFARQMIEFDEGIRARNLPEASRGTLGYYARSVRVFGAELIPKGSFMALSNHPGMSDTLSAFVALNRPDLKIIALDRPFLNALPNVSHQLFYVKDDPASRIGLVREVSAHLRNGGAALTFPAGHIEPDPDVHEGAVESLQTWTDSVGVFLRMAPESAILPMLIRGVVWKRTAQHWLTKIKETREEREKLAAALQLLAYVMLKVKPVSVRVQIGRPIYGRELGTTDTQVVHRTVLAEMKRLIENPPEGEGVNLL